MGVFRGDVITKWLPNGRDMVLTTELSYTDNAGKVWTAYAGSTINGASIPRIFWVLVGSPFCGRYRRPSVIHDVNSPSDEPWQAVHRVFLEMMETEGVSRVKRYLMFKAVWYGAKRW